MHVAATLARLRRRTARTPRSSSPRTNGRPCALLADYIIPRDERSGSATDAKVPEYMDFLLADKDVDRRQAQSPMRGGLAWLDTECQQALRQDPSSRATDAQRRQVLDDIA